MTTAAPYTDRTSRPRWWLGTAAVGTLALADFGAFLGMLGLVIDRFQRTHHDPRSSFLLWSDLGQPLAVGMWCLLVVNGLLLCGLRGTRQVGVGLLLAAVAFAVPVVLWAVWAILTFTWG